MCATLATTTLATSLPAFAAQGPVPLLRLAAEDAPASVLGLDSKDDQAGDRLTAALRKAFANRGLSGGEEISLEELRLTMGCTNDGVACLAEGGKTLGVRRLVFGYLSPAGEGYQLDIQILDVQAGTLEAQASMELAKGDLAKKSIDDTAARVVNELMPPQEEDTTLPPRPEPLPEVEPEVEDPPEVEDKPPRDKKIWFGLEKPTPAWKWAGFGTSLALTLAAAGLGTYSALYVAAKETDSFGFRPDLLAAARASLRSPANLNRVPPDSPDLCLYNITNDDGSPIVHPSGGPGARNQGVANVCTRGERFETTQYVAFAATGLFGLSTLVFTGVLLIHKRKPGAEAMLRRGLSLGVTPHPEGGLSFSSGLRF